MSIPQIEVGKTYRDRDGHAYHVVKAEKGVVRARRDDGKNAIAFPLKAFEDLVSRGEAAAATVAAAKPRGAFSLAMDLAPRDGRHLQVLVPTGDPEMPLSREIAWWAKERNLPGEGWEGDWLYDDEPGNWAHAQPVAWAPILEIPAGMWAEYAAKAKADIAAREKAATEAAAKAPKALPPPPGKGNGKAAKPAAPKVKPRVDVFDAL